MRITRSATRVIQSQAEVFVQASTRAITSEALASRTRATGKRKAEPEPSETKSETAPKRTKKTNSKLAASGRPITNTTNQPNAGVPIPDIIATTVGQVESRVAQVQGGRDLEHVLLPAVLSFSFEDAKKHLVGTDGRFEEIFNTLPCKPYEHLEKVHPFRALVSSILGQQISWMAARSVYHKFIRLYDSTIPEKPDDYSVYKTPSSFFPTPQQVCATDIPTLRTAGLSARKAEYVLDLATRFADGRLSVDALAKTTDEELSKMLIEVRGIGQVSIYMLELLSAMIHERRNTSGNVKFHSGRSSVDMFAIFSLRRPDILPVGDLGVQRGLARWYLARHNASYRYTISPEKHTTTIKAKRVKKQKKEEKEMNSDVESESNYALPSAGGATCNSNVSETVTQLERSGLVPATFTPSIKNKLQKSVDSRNPPPPLPEGLTPAVLRSRLDGKKIKGAFLTPLEMQALTESWKPYRSLGVYYMWSLADAEV